MIPDPTKLISKRPIETTAKTLSAKFQKYNKSLGCFTQNPVSNSQSNSIDYIPQYQQPSNPNEVHVESQSEFIVYLEELVKMERKLETSRISLAERPDFNVLDAFNLFDSTGRKCLYNYDIKSVLATELGIFASLEDIQKFLNQYGRSQINSIMFEDFISFFLPETDPHLSKDLKSRKSTSKTFRDPINKTSRIEIFTIETRIRFKDVWRAFFAIEDKCSEMKDRISRRPGFHIKEAFDSTLTNNPLFMRKTDVRKLI
jgi:hypothetical protein